LHDKRTIITTTASTRSIKVSLIVNERCFVVFWCTLSRFLCTALPRFRTFWHSAEAHASSNKHRDMHTNTYIDFISRILSDSYSVYVYIFIFSFGCLGTTFPTFCPNFSDPTDLSESRSVSSRSDFRMSDDHPWGTCINTSTNTQISKICL
jgi:hypothetical protein